MGASGYRAHSGLSLTDSIPYPRRLTGFLEAQNISIGVNTITILNNLEMWCGTGAQGIIPQAAPWWRWRVVGNFLIESTAVGAVTLDIFLIYAPYVAPAGVPQYPTYAGGGAWVANKPQDNTFSRLALAVVPAGTLNLQVVGNTAKSNDIFPTARPWPQLAKIATIVGYAGALSYFRGGQLEGPGLYVCASASAAGLTCTLQAESAVLEPANPELEAGNGNNGVLLGDF